MELLYKYIEDEAGATAIEYGLIAALLGVSLVTGARTIGVEITGMFNKTDAELSKV